MVAVLSLAAGAVLFCGLTAGSWADRPPKPHRGTAFTRSDEQPHSGHAPSSPDTAATQPPEGPPASSDERLQTADAARRWFAEAPERADADGSALFATLLNRSDFAGALELAEAAPAELRAEWLATIFAAWARQDPVAAREIGELLIRQGAPREAWQPVLRAWSESTASQLAEYALTLPHGEARTVALDLALEHWIRNEPGAAAAWIARLAPSPERDRAFAALASRTDSAVRPLGTALAWAAQIASAALRLEATACVLREWAQTDPASARAYAEHAGGFTAAQRSQLRAALIPTHPEL